MMTTMKNLEESVFLNDGLTYGANAVVSRVESVVNQPVMMSLDESNAKSFNRRTATMAQPGFSIESEDRLNRARFPMVSRYCSVIDEPLISRRERCAVSNGDWKRFCASKVCPEVRMPFTEADMKTASKKMNSHKWDSGLRTIEASKILQNQSQVSSSNWEQNWNEISLGYRYGVANVTNVANLNPAMEIIEVPMFPDVDLRQWISWMEQYFTQKQLTDLEKLHMAHGFIVGEAEQYVNLINSMMPIRNWKEMKETLLLKFGADDDPEKIRLIEYQNKCHDYLMNYEQRRLKREEFQMGCHTTESMAKEVILKTNSCAAMNSNLEPIFVHQQEAILYPQGATGSNKDIVLESEMMQEEKPLFPEEPDLISGDAASSLLQTEAWPNMDCIAEIMHRNDSILLVEQEANISFGSEDNESSLMHTCCFSGFVPSMEGSSTKSVEVNVITVEENVMMPQIWTEISTPAVVDAISTEQEAKLSFIYESVLGISQEADMRPFVVQPQHIDNSLLVDSLCAEATHAGNSGWKIAGLEFMVLLLCDHMLPHIPSKEELRKCVKTWKFKFKEMQYVEEKQQHGRKNSLLLHWFHRSLNTISYAQAPQETLEQWDEQWQLQSKTGKSILIFHISQFNYLLDFAWGKRLLRETLKQLRNLQSKQGIQTVYRCTLTYGEFHVKHKWKSKSEKLLTAKEVGRIQITCCHIVACCYRFRRVQPHASSLENSSIFFFNTSLRASLFSKGRVYKRYLTCLLIVDVLLWLLTSVWKVGILMKDDRKQRVKEEVTTHWLLGVIKERGSLIEIKGHPLQILIQDKMKWKKLYKSRMFKYKQRLLEHMIKVSKKLDWPVHLYKSQPYVKRNACQTSRYKFSLDTMLLLQLGCLQQVPVPLLLFYHLLKKLLVTCKEFKHHFHIISLWASLFSKGDVLISFVNIEKLTWPFT